MAKLTLYHAQVVICWLNGTHAGTYNSQSYVTGSAKRYNNAQAMIFLHKRCCSKTRNIVYSLKKNWGGGGGLGIYNSLPTLTPKLRN